MTKVVVRTSLYTGHSSESKSVHRVCVLAKCDSILFNICCLCLLKSGQSMRMCLEVCRAVSLLLQSHTQSGSPVECCQLCTFCFSTVYYLFTFPYMNIPKLNRFCFIIYKHADNTFTFQNIYGLYIVWRHGNYEVCEKLVLHFALSIKRSQMHMY